MDDIKAPRPLAVVTGASSGIGFHLARIAAEHGYDLVLAADTPLAQAVSECELLGSCVEPVQCDLATTAGTQQLIDTLGERDVGLLIANAGHGLGGPFLEQDFADVLHVVNTNITGTLHLIHHVGRRMRERAHGEGFGRILITGSVAGLQPGTYEAVYAASKAFIDSFAIALRNELKATPVTVTLLMPGATDTEFYERAGMSDTPIGQWDRKSDAAQVARIGFAAMLRGEADVVSGWFNKVQAAVSKFAPNELVAEAHARLAEPGAGNKQTKE